MWPVTRPHKPIPCCKVRRSHKHVPAIKSLLNSIAKFNHNTHGDTCTINGTRSNQQIQVQSASQQARVHIYPIFIKITVVSIELPLFIYQWTAVWQLVWNEISAMRGYVRQVCAHNKLTISPDLSHGNHVFYHVITHSWHVICTWLHATTALPLKETYNKAIKVIWGPLQVHYLGV